MPGRLPQGSNLPRRTGSTWYVRGFFGSDPTTRPSGSLGVAASAARRRIRSMSRGAGIVLALSTLGVATRAPTAPSVQIRTDLSAGFAPGVRAVALNVDPSRPQPWCATGGSGPSRPDASDPRSEGGEPGTPPDAGFPSHDALILVWHGGGTDRAARIASPERVSVAAVRGEGSVTEAFPSSARGCRAAPDAMPVRSCEPSRSRTWSRPPPV